MLLEGRNKIKREKSLNKSAGLTHTFLTGGHDKIPDHYTLAGLPGKRRKEVKHKVLLFICSDNGFSLVLALTV